jgi:hypothetical protein
MLHTGSYATLMKAYYCVVCSGYMVVKGMSMSNMLPSGMEHNT